MSLWRQLTHGTRVLFRRADADQDLGDEVQHYLDQLTAANVARGMAPADALRAARVEMGNTTAVRDEVRSHGWENAVGSVVADLRYAGRMLRKSPVFTIVIVAVISLGTGAVTTVFSAMNTLLFRPVPGTSGTGPLVTIARRNREGERMSASHFWTEYLASRSRALSGVGAMTKVSLNVRLGDLVVPAYGEMVSGNYFTLLGARPAIGRFMLPEEGRTPASHPVIVLSHAFWQRSFDSDPGVVGRTLTVNGQLYTVIGVAAEEFRGLSSPVVTDAWVPLMMYNQLRPGTPRRMEDPGFIAFRTFGRLADGATADAAAQELSRLTAALAGEGGEPARFARFDQVQVRPLRGIDVDDERGVLIGFLGLLLGAAGLVLLIASVNIASMFSARAVVRRRELAVRAALGAGRGRLVRQLLTEILVLFILGAAGGVMLAVLATSTIERMSIPFEIRLMLELTPDLRVMLFALVVSLLVGLAFGLPPALRAAGHDITSRLRDGAAGSGVRRGRLANLLIVSQLAAALVLLVAAGLFLRALSHGSRVHPGFDADGVATFTFFSESWAYDRTRTQQFYDALRERVAGLPGVTAASYTMHLPLTMHSNIADIRIDGVQGRAGEPPGLPVSYGQVDVDYFAVLRIPLLAGRSLASTDDERAPRVAVVNEAFARAHWPDGSALGRTFTFFGQKHTIVGVARDAKYASLSEELIPFVYFSLRQASSLRRALIVRVTADPAMLASAVHAAIREIDPAIPRPPLVTMREANSIVLFPQRIAAAVTGALGAVGLLLAAIGLYGMIAYSVSRRTREIGIRLALGARRTGVVGLIVREGMRLAVVGVVVGLILAAGATQLIAKFLFDVSPLDAVTFGGMSLLFVAVALLASYLPARRAAAADPMAILRAE